MSHIVTPTGVKAWPLAGMLPRNTFINQRRDIELLGLSRRASYEALYRTQPWVHTVVNKLARGIARLPAVAYDAMGDAEPQGDLQYLMNRPYPRASGFQLREATVGSLAIYGEALTVKDRGSRPFGTPEHLWPIPWRYVTPIGAENEPIEAYLVQIGSVNRIFHPDDVIHHQWWSPDGLLGVSPLEALRTTLALEDAAQRYSIASFANGGRPSGVVSTERPMPKPDRELLKAELESAYGGVDNAFRIALLTHGLKWQPISYTAVEAEVINLRKVTREEVAAVYDLAPPQIHILDRATFSNIEEQHRSLYQDTYGTWAAMIEGIWDVQLCDSELAFHGSTIKLDMRALLRGNEEQRSTSQQRRFLSGTRTPNELRAEDDLDPVPGSMLPDGTPDPEHPANQIYVPVNMARVTADGPEAVGGASGSQGGAGGENVAPSAEKIRDFLALAEAAGMVVRD